MLFLGLGLILLGALAILAAVFVSEPGRGGELLGFDVTTLSAFLVGVAAGAAVLWGFSILKWGTRRELAHRRERKELARLQEKHGRAEDGARRTGGGPDTDPTADANPDPNPGPGTDATPDRAPGDDPRA